MDRRGQLFLLPSKRTQVGPYTILGHLERYWRDLRGAKALPVRSAINPAQIDEALPYSFISERVSPRVGRFRVSGQAINRMLGCEARGTPVSLLFTPSAHPALENHLEACLEGPSIVELPLRANRGLGRSAITGRLLLLPLSNSNGAIDRILGAILVDGKTDAARMRFDIPEDGSWRIESVKHSVFLPPQHQNQRKSTPETKGPERARPALKLVVNNA